MQIHHTAPHQSYCPPQDGQIVLEEEIKEWHFHVYFLQNNEKSCLEALTLREAICALNTADPNSGDPNANKNGIFVAVPLETVNMGPRGPHTVGSYEVWCPTESFAKVFSYMTLYRGDLSILIHPLTKEERKDHDTRKVWLGQPFGIDLSVLPEKTEVVPLQYPKLKMGYSAPESQ